MKRSLLVLVCVLAIFFFGFGNVFAQEKPLEPNIQEYDIYLTPPTEELEYEITSVTKTPSFQLGIVTHWAIGHHLDMVVQIGIPWVRTGVGWDFIEPELTEPPTYQWDIADKIVADCRVRNLKILWGLAYTPSWASDNGQKNGVPRSSVAQEHWRKFVKAVVQRYQNDIDYFDVWNEPNNEKFWLGSVNDYFDFILKPAWEEIKAIDPNKKIVAPTLETNRGTHIKVEDFFSRLAKLNGANYIDILSQNVYEDKPEEVIRQFEKGDYECFLRILCFKKRSSLFTIYRKNGFANHPVWVTEFGWKSNKVGEGHQAVYLVDTIERFSRRPRFQNAFIYSLMDDDRFPQKWGVMRGDETPKKAFWLLKDFCAQSGFYSIDYGQLSEVDCDGYGNNVFVPSQKDSPSPLYLVPKPIK